MAYRKVLRDGDETLRKISKPVVDFDSNLWTLLDDMDQTMQKSEGAGLAAVQVGVLRRAVIVEIEPKEYLEIINPQIIKTKGKVADTEGCLSVPGFFCDVERPQYVKIKAQDRQGREYEFEAIDYIARCICHEIDHLDGILFVDHTEEGQKYKKQHGVE